MSRLRCFLTPRAWILSSRAENESLGGGLSRTFFAAMRLGEDLGSAGRLAKWPIAANDSSLVSLTKPYMHLSSNEVMPQRPIHVLVLFLAAFTLALTLPAQQLPSAGTVQASVAAPPSPTWDTFSDTWVATDALGRSLPACPEAGLPRQQRTVGVFYFLWDYPAGGLGPFDISRILARDPQAVTNAASLLWGPMLQFHHWGESIFGYYLSDDEAVVRKHAQMLADAGVDVIIFDVTNQQAYPRSWKTLCRVCDQIRREGGQTPQIAFLCPFWDAKKVARELWQQLYRSEEHTSELQSLTNLVC